MGVNNIGSFINNMAFEAESNVKGRTVSEPFLNKNPCKEGEVFESCRKYYHRRDTQACPHWQTSRKVTNQSSDRCLPPSALPSGNRLRILMQFFLVWKLSKTIKFSPSRPLTLLLFSLFFDCLVLPPAAPDETMCFITLMTIDQPCRMLLSLDLLRQG